MANEDLIIENGVLTKYVGKGGEVVIPDGVTTIGDLAFLNNRTLTSVCIPEGVTKIGSNAFLDCKKLREVVLPDSVKLVGIKAFAGCVEVTRLSIPAGLQAIGIRAFELPNLTTLELRDGAKIGKDLLGVAFPVGLVPAILDLVPAMDDAAFKQYVLTVAVWSQFDFDTRCRLLTLRSAKSQMSAYNTLIPAAEADRYGEYFIALLEGEPSAVECAAAGMFLVGFAKKLSEGVAGRLQAAIGGAKNGKKAAEKAQKGLEEKKNAPPEIDPAYTDIAKALLLRHMDEKTSVDALISRWNKRLKECFAIATSDLPSILYADGKPVEPFVFCWLLVDNAGEDEYEKAHPIDTPWYSAETAEVLRAIAPDSLQAALLRLAHSHLGLKGNNKKMYLAYPICRLADNETMTALTSLAPDWSSYTSGINAPSLSTFRSANAYSNTRAAMLFADKYKELGHYAYMRGMDEDALRDKYLSDVGLDAQGCKRYDLGSAEVTVRMGADYHFIVELPDGKPAKSLPKKGADPDKYAAATKDFADMKKEIRRIVRNRHGILFEAFLSGAKRKATAWQESYLVNPLLHQVAELLVWQQGKSYFTLTRDGAVDSTGAAYTIGDRDDVGVAHPMEMTVGERTAWQRYFTAHGLKQPFAQIWEPVVVFDTVQDTRYKGMKIPYYRLANQAKHGIKVYDYDYHNDISFTIADCTASVVRLDWSRHSINMSDNFEITSFKVDRRSRRANHIVAYLDQATIVGRIMADDVGVAAHLPSFTLAQIMNFIRIAGENECVNVTALLLNYKNEHFADYNPMDEFTLDD